MLTTNWAKASICDSSGCVEIKFVKATDCGESSHCVEVAPDGDRILIRDSNNPDLVLSFTRNEWESFLDGARKGEFDFTS